MARPYDVESLLGVAFEETPDTLAYDLSMQFVSQVVAEADRQGVSLGELARRMGIKQPTLCGMLRSDSNLTLKTMARMALALGCEIEAPKLVSPRTSSPAASAASVVDFEALKAARGAVHGSREVNEA